MSETGSFGHGDSLELTQLLARYREKDLLPEAVIEQVLHRADHYADPAVWITRFSRDDIFGQLKAARARAAAGAVQPLLGVPFAVKDNIDVAGKPTTAACPAFSYVPDRSATVVEKLCGAGAILIGKTNLDQFATGLVGARSPYGACRNVYDARYISGGSSSGSAVAVAGGLVSFSLGTDTAGSGRVPAAFNNLVGLKPSCGRLSTAGVVPACRSLDCVSIFTHNCEGARILLHIAEGLDSVDPYSRSFSGGNSILPGAEFVFGVLGESDREFFGDEQAENLYSKSILAMEQIGGRAIAIDFGLFKETAALLYFGPWVAERAMVARNLLRDQSQALLPVTRSILEAGLKLSGIQVFEGLHQLQSLRARASEQWSKISLLLFPTAGTIYTLEQVQLDPLGTNTNLGRYTNFVNLLDLCALAVPTGFRTNGLPTGSTLIAPAGRDDQLIDLGDRLHKILSAKD